MKKSLTQQNVKNIINILFNEGLINKKITFNDATKIFDSYGVITPEHKLPCPICEHMQDLSDLNGVGIADYSKRRCPKCGSRLKIEKISAGVFLIEQDTDF